MTTAPGTTQRSSDFDPVRNLWQRRELIGQLIRRELSLRYRGSYLGLLWSFIVPLLMLLIYTFVFSAIFEARWGQGSGEMRVGEFALTLFAGLTPFNLFSEIMNRSPHLILAVPNYVKKVVFPLEALPVVAVGSALFHSLISIGILVAGTRLVLGFFSPTLFLLPLAYLPLLLLTLGLSWFLASLGVYIRDIGQGIGVAVQMLFFLSPILYSVDAVPEQYRIWLYLNPLTTVLSGFRRTLLWQEPLAWSAWAAWTMLAALVAWLGYVWFMKTKKGFADVL